MGVFVLHSLRVSRWIIWIVFLAYALYVYTHRADFVNSFGQLYAKDELIMFGVPMLAMAIGFAELAVREKISGRAQPPAR